MTDEFQSRRTQWQPPARPAWVEAINAEGRCMDIKAVVPLDESSLLQSAMTNTGLQDFGSEDWREPFQVLIRALDEEANLNLMGRLMTRSDLLMYLQARLEVEDWYKRHPEIEDEIIRKPLYIIGQGRSGTSMLQNMLAEDPNSGTVRTWEAYKPCPPPETATYDTDTRIAELSPLITQLTRVTPEISSMHEFDAVLPTENIHLQCLSFMSPAWFNSFGGQVPSYNAYMAGKSPLPVYEYEKRVMKLLQWRNPRKHWVMKSPYCILHLREIRQVYPDVGFIWTHRDPVKALSSVVNLLGTLFWSRTDTPFIGNTLDMYSNADQAAGMMCLPIEWLKSGELPTEQLINIQYADLLEDPIKAARSIYKYFGIEWTSAGQQAMESYMDAHPRQSRPKHRYDVGPGELINKEREAFATYQTFFNVPNEI